MQQERATLTERLHLHEQTRAELESMERLCNTLREQLGEAQRDSQTKAQTIGQFTADIAAREVDSPIVVDWAYLPSFDCAA